MTARIIDGKRDGARILRTLQVQIQKRRTPPTLVTVMVGQRPDSQLYVAMKERAAKEIGVQTVSVHCTASIAQKTVTDRIRRVAAQHPTSGILLQLPLPSHLDTTAVISTIPRDQDIDGLRPDSPFLSPFLRAMLHCVATGRPVKKTVLVLANPSPLRRRLVTELKRLQYTVTVDSASRRIPPVSKRVGTIITFRGRGPIIRREHCTAQTVIVDGGIRSREGRVCGDVDQRVAEHIRALSPVPGGVGPLTIAYLLQNLVTKK